VHVFFHDSKSVGFILFCYWTV